MTQYEANFEDFRLTLDTGRYTKVLTYFDDH